MAAAGAEASDRGRLLALPTLEALHGELVACRACPRLVAWREQVARVKVRRFQSWTYWGRPVPGFGDPRAWLLVVGLAPAAHGANRTGRMFTGDRSGDFLFAAMHRAGFASQPASTSRDDGLALAGAFLAAPCRCAPPANKPTPRELSRCAHWLDAEVALLPSVRVLLALGAIGWVAALELEQRRGSAPAKPWPKFAHGAEVPLGGGRTLLGSYHVSQQNTQTGRLTPAMFDRVLARAREISGGRAPADQPRSDKAPKR